MRIFFSLECIWRILQPHFIIMIYNEDEFDCSLCTKDVLLCLCKNKNAVKFTERVRDENL